ncbi:MAG: 2,3-bisphosphoglycerate-independent phosphoglycerate mutase [Gammaproteobacteria bacterium]|nr:2,3-bisphosphoglycerate-independent phosphoglycerate mutase [Gammaproteobacteria bacterium]
MPLFTGPNDVPDAANRPRPVVLLILDGWGHREDPRDNAIAQADVPNWRRLWDTRPTTLVHTEGGYVGLPDGQMGNSEVGHMNIGAGRVVYQELTRIDAAIESGAFFENPELVAACEEAIANDRVLHIMGLLSPGGVHSHERHIFAMLELAHRRGVPRVAVHAFLDGRDMPPRSARASLESLVAKCAELGNARVASVSGRYYAMDRDRRWERVTLAWDAIVNAKGERAADPLAALEAAYARGEDDEFVLPTVIEGAQPMSDGTSVVFMNFRADRARQLTAAFVDDDFEGFPRRQPRLGSFVCLTRYDAAFKVPVAFEPDDLRNTLGEVLATHGMRQLRIAETEKYAHVTFFLNGGREEPFEGEERILVPSPKVATYDLQPEMSCPEVTDRLVEAIGSGRFDAIICNYANPDMVGHSGDLQAAIKAVEAVDAAVGRVVEATLARGGELLVTADHGNVEMMRDPDTGQPHTAHTVGPVGLIYVGSRQASLREGGSLRDLAPTLLDMAGIPVPEEMTGRSLLQPA